MSDNTRAEIIEELKVAYWMEIEAPADVPIIRGELLTQRRPVGLESARRSRLPVPCLPHSSCFRITDQFCSQPR